MEKPLREPSDCIHNLTKVFKPKNVPGQQQTCALLRLVHSICNNPIPECVGFIPNADAVCTTVFVIDYLQGIRPSEHDCAHGVWLRLAISHIGL